MKKFNLPSIVAINRFPTDSEKEIDKVKEVCKSSGVNAVLAEHWAEGGKGAKSLAEEVVEIVESNQGKIDFLYADSDTPENKIKKVANEIYRATEVVFLLKQRKTKWISKLGFDNFPVCMAKTQYGLALIQQTSALPRAQYSS